MGGRYGDVIAPWDTRTLPLIISLLGIALTVGTTYNYKVSAHDAVPNDSGQSNQASATALAVDNSSPTQPANLNASTNSLNPGAVILNWTASTDSTVGDTITYEVYRDGMVIKDKLSAVTYFDNDPNLIAGNVYNYYVIAIDAAGNTSQQSDTVPATPQ